MSFVAALERTPTQDLLHLLRCRAVSKVVGLKAAPQVVTLTFVLMWYGLNVAFNLLNKTIFNYFPFPYTVSAIHVVVGLAYCSLTYLLGAKKASFGRVRAVWSGIPCMHVYLIALAACAAFGTMICWLGFLLVGPGQPCCTTPLLVQESRNVHCKRMIGMPLCCHSI